MPGFEIKDPYTGIQVPYKLQKVAYYRENFQVFFKWTPKIIGTLAIVVGVIPLTWTYLVKQQQDQEVVVNRKPRKL
ncbi:hypothetical protein DICPUDRAFT_156072 [Dictyostelium purpureum]|uniref:NADH dehydrogenase [ubiquinone] 1 beta subcomplex subunit 4 n=1 Tax=Dictyostelium purpureum TaxID=5786 RepID=F0ZVM4_DICPU|nr:uncharacterized protein DICPUDRAFT_156072 [Dictyostelium purpureum]EGC32007.1 hypothetical protein DICPUDRAFT_156072 [Dictyostelium purpureum]|eukprot:XP_003291463.1 hypothetical protein DICPUDRAFT_156072 [Dictyostelium purpureum]